MAAWHELNVLLASERIGQRKNGIANDTVNAAHTPRRELLHKKIR